LLPRAGALKLHKLLFYVQGWHLAFTGRRAFPETIEAWDNGPVVADVWHARQGHRPVPPATSLNWQTSTIVAFVAANYGRHSGKKLMEWTHQEGSPWAVVDHGPDRFSFVNGEITDDLIEQFFKAEMAKHPVGQLLDANPDVRRRLHAALEDFGSRPPTRDTEEALAALLR